MHYISAVMFAFSANMDNVAIGLSYGIKGVRIRFRNNLLIACLTSLGTLLSMVAGSTVTALLPPEITTKLGCGILIAMGLWFVITSLHRRFHPVSGEAENSAVEACEEWAEELFSDNNNTGIVNQNAAFISWRESLILAIALMINNLGFGIGARIAGLPILITSACTFIISILLLSAGVSLGEHFGDTFFGKYTDLITGCMIIVLGLYEFIV